MMINKLTYYKFPIAAFVFIVTCLSLFPTIYNYSNYVQRIPLELIDIQKAVELENAIPDALDVATAEALIFEGDTTWRVQIYVDDIGDSEIEFQAIGAELDGVVRDLIKFYDKHKVVHQLSTKNKKT